MRCWLKSVNLEDILPPAKMKFDNFLFQSIKDEGILNPIHLWHGRDQLYQILDGDQRFRIAQKLEYSCIDSLVFSLDVQEYFHYCFYSGRESIDTVLKRYVGYYPETNALTVIEAFPITEKFLTKKSKFKKTIPLFSLLYSAVEQKRFTNYLKERKN